MFSYDETLAAWFYYDTTNGDTQWNHPLDDIYREKVIAARAEAAASAVRAAVNSETEQTEDIPRDTDAGDKDDNEDNSEYKHLKLVPKLLPVLDADENTEISVDTNEILTDAAMMPLAPLGPIANKKPLPLPPLKKLSPLGSIDTQPLASLDHKPLGGIGRRSSGEKSSVSSFDKDKSSLLVNPNPGLKKSPDAAKDNVEDSDNANVSPKRSQRKGLRLGLGKTFLKSESLESLEARDSEDQNSAVSGGSGSARAGAGAGAGILKAGAGETSSSLLRQAMMQREEKRIMFDLGANVEFASEVSPSLGMIIILMVSVPDRGGE